MKFPDSGTPTSIRSSPVPASFVFPCEGTIVTKVRIEELKPPIRVVRKTIFSFRPEWCGTTIRFLKTGGGGAHPGN